MDLLIKFYRSTVGKKIIMALTGLALFGFVLGHMAGNMKFFFGTNAAGIYYIDHYGELLREILQDFLGKRTFLWMVRLGLLGCVVMHALTAVQLWLLNRRAKPISYKSPSYLSSTLASRTMIYGGLFLGCFIVFHLLHLTLGAVDPSNFQEGKVYSNLYRAFQHTGLVAFYVLSMLFLALHLFHGAWSLFQTLGIDTPRLNPALRAFAVAVSIALFIGFSAVPFSVYFGLVPAPASQVAMQVSE